MKRLRILLPINKGHFKTSKISETLFKVKAEQEFKKNKRCFFAHKWSVLSSEAHAVD